MRAGKVPLTRKAIAQLIGKVFIQKSAVNLLSTVLDTPEFFWSAPDSMQVSAGGATAVRSALRSARLPVNSIGSPINYANRLIGSPITSQSTGRACPKPYPQARESYQATGACAGMPTVC